MKFWCDLQLVFYYLKMSNFLWRKNAAYYTPMGVLYPDRGIYPDWYLSPACVQYPLNDLSEEIRVSPLHRIYLWENRPEILKGKQTSQWHHKMLFGVSFCQFNETNNDYILATSFQHLKTAPRNDLHIGAFYNLCFCVLVRRNWLYLYKTIPVMPVGHDLCINLIITLLFT